MDNREFLIKQDELQKEYFAKQAALVENLLASLGPKYTATMDRVQAEASSRIQAVAGQASGLQEQLANRAQKTLEMIESQAQNLAESSHHVLATAQASSARVATAEAQVSDRLNRLVAMAESHTQAMVRAVDTGSDQALGLLAKREEEAAKRLVQLKDVADKAVHNVAQEAAAELKRGVEAWGVMVKWVMVPLFFAACLAAVVGAAWAGKSYGEQLGYDQARSIARNDVKAELAVTAYVLKPTYNPESGSVMGLTSERLSRPIIVVEGQPRWMNHDATGWYFGNVRLKEDWHVAEVWDSKDKAQTTLSYYLVTP